MQQNIRNFSIIAHINHGKSTLADRFLELTGTVEKKKMREQYLDQMDLERERGVTIKMQPVRMIYHAEIPNPIRQLRWPSEDKSQNKKTLNFELLTLNLIDTPGHLDFAYEVSRALKAVEGAVLLVEATSGIQAQTLAHLELAQKEGLKIIPVINKIDLPNAQIEKVEKEIIQLTGSQPILISAKTGQNVEKVLEKIIEEIPCPFYFSRGHSCHSRDFFCHSSESGNPVSLSVISANDVNQEKEGIQNSLEDPNISFEALVFDSIYDFYQGVIFYIRVFNGEIKKGDEVFFKEKKIKIKDVGIFKPNLFPVSKLAAGEIGYIVTGLKEVENSIGQIISSIEKKDLSIGQASLSAMSAQAGGKQDLTKSGFHSSFQSAPQPMVFVNSFCKEGKNISLFKESLEKLKLNDPSFVFSPIASFLGNGFSLGCLGVFHLQIVKERLKREYGLELIFTRPSVTYQVKLRNNEILSIKDLSQLPSLENILYFEEPWVEVKIVSPEKYFSQIISLAKESKGIYKETKYLSSEKIILIFEMPLRLVIFEFFDKLKSTSSGFASMNYKFLNFRKQDLAKMEIWIAEENREELSLLVYKDEIFSEGRKIVEKLKELIPQELFKIAIQAKVGGKVVAREDISALKKNVLAKLYGGDVTRKKKLLEKQKRGKKRMKNSGRVEIPADVFFKILS